VTKQTLTEDAFLQQVYNAVDTGNVSNLDGLMSEETTEVKAFETLADTPLELQPPEEDARGGKEDGLEQPADKIDTADKKDGATQDAPVDDWRSKLPDDVKALVEKEVTQLAQQNERLNQYYRSNEGRVSALMRQINELKSQTSTPAQPPVRDATPAATAQVDDDEFLQDLKESDPALYTVLKQREAKNQQAVQRELERARKEFEKTLDSRIAPIAQAEQERAIHAELEKVQAAVPNVAEIVNSPEWTQFKTVVPKGVRALAESSTADEMLTALWMFHSWMGGGTTATQVENTNKEVVTPPANTEQQRLIDDRNRRLQGTSVGTKAPVTTTTATLDDASEIARIYEILRQQDESYKKK
jgi:hypothetical protein